MEPETTQAAPVLINRYRLDEDCLRCSYRQAMKPIVAVQIALALAILGAAVWYTIRYFQLFSASPKLLIMVLLLYLLGGFEIWRALNAVNKQVSRTLKRVEELKHVRAYNVTLRFEEAEIVAGTDLDDTTQRLHYESVKKLSRGDGLILLRTKARLIYTLDPAGFENGGEADFWKLMNEKCPQAVPKQYRQG